jgi:hypothetical protein
MLKHSGNASRGDYKVLFAVRRRRAMTRITFSAK